MSSPTYTEVWVEGPQYRIIPTRFPPINFFERYTPPELMDAAFEIESLTTNACWNRWAICIEWRRKTVSPAPAPAW